MPNISRVGDNLRSSIMGLWDVFEGRIVGVLPAEVRSRMHLDVLKSCALSVMATCLLFIPAILGRLGASAELIAGYYSAGYLGVFFSGVCLWLMRRWGVRVVSLASWSVGRSVWFLGVFVTSAFWLAVVMTLHSFLELWVGVVNPKLIEQLYTAQYRGRIMSFVHLMSAVVMVCFTPVAGLILDRTGYRVLMIIGGMFGLGAVIAVNQIMARVVDGLNLRGQVSPVVVSGVWADRPFVLFLISVVLYGFGSLVPASIYPIVQMRQLGLSYSSIGWLGFVRSIAWVIGLLFGGWLTDRYGCLCCLQGVFLINAMVMLPYIWASDGLMLVPSFIAFGLVIAGSELWITYSIIELSDPMFLPEYTAICMMVIGARGLVAPLLGVVLLRMGLSQTNLLVVGAVLTICAAAVLFPAIAGRQARNMLG